MFNFTGLLQVLLKHFLGILGFNAIYLTMSPLVAWRSG